MVGNLFNSLVTIDLELILSPDLAESWEVLENSKVYVFHLRKGRPLSWRPGRGHRRGRQVYLTHNMQRPPC